MHPVLKKAYDLIEKHNIVIYKSGFCMARDPNKCPCGGQMNDWHSHASSCIHIGGSVDFSKKWEYTEEEMKQFNNKVPNPGSPEALAIGCKCPVLDNCHGKGYLVPGSGSFCVAEHCPIHGKVAQNEDETKTEER